MTTAKSKLETLTSTLSTIAGLPVEITIRGKKKFTFSFEGQNAKAENKIKKYFGNGFNWMGTSGYDSEADYTCLFAEC